VAVSGTFALNVAPSAWLIITDGIVIVLSAPAIAEGGCGLLLTTIANGAPALCAFFTLTVKLQRPRSTIGISPGATANGSQPSLTVPGRPPGGGGAATPSFA
jgi:hypothetical protein